jgi:ATP-dependent helicase/DNAse subunit B
MTNTDENRKLSHKQELVITGLLAGAKVTEACKAANVDRTTFYVWTRDDDFFLEELNRRRSEVIEESMERLRGMMHKAVDKLETLLNSESEEIARKAANSIIEYSLKWAESDDLESRLDEVESLVLQRKTYR